MVIMGEAIVLEKLTKYYDGFLALDRLTLKIKEKERVALLGPNGAGKSTALKILCGLLKPSAGRVLIDGVDVVQERERAISGVGVILETPEFYPFLTPEETLRYLGRLRGMGGRTLDRRIHEVLKLVGLERWQKVKIEKFSRGMKQRLGLAQAFLHDPPIIVLDEPALGLDPRGMADIRKILKGIRKRKTIFLASHMLSEVEQVCDRVAVIDQGKLKAFDRISKLKRKYRTFEKAFLKLTGGKV